MAEIADTVRTLDLASAVEERRERAELANEALSDVLDLAVKLLPVLL